LKEAKKNWSAPGAGPGAGKKGAWSKKNSKGKKSLGFKVDDVVLAGGSF